MALLLAPACGSGEGDPAGGAPSGGAGLVVDYPRDGSVFPPDFVPPTFLWHDEAEGVTHWQVRISFEDGGEVLRATTGGGPPPEPVIDRGAIGANNEIYPGTEYQRSAEAWGLPEDLWAEVRRRAVDSPATVTFTGHGADDPERERSRGAVRLSISSDPVGAPIFYRDVPLMPALGKKGTIQPVDPNYYDLIAWRLKDVSKPGSRVVLRDMPTCANCHSFSDDGETLGMDVDGPTGDKGNYMITPVAREMTVTDEDVISWNSFSGQEEDHRTIGFLARIGPRGKYVVTTLNESLYVTNFIDYKFLQVFYPTRGILGWYSTETEEIKALPGADDPTYVHCSPVWSPDGETLVFSRALAVDPYEPGRELAKYPNDPNEREMRYDLYRMPFNAGRGGTPVRIEGASENGMSNTFPKVSPDGKWIVYTKCANGLLMRPDGRLWIVPFAGGEAREMECNTSLMNSWHSFSPNGRWMVFSSKQNTPYTQLFLTHLDEEGNSTPAILIPNATAANRAANIPEFLNAAPDAIRNIEVPAVDHQRSYRRGTALLDEGRYEEAIDEAKSALARKPEYAPVRVALGWALVQAGRVEEGIRELEGLLEKRPEYASAHHSLGLALVRVGRPNEALGHLEMAVLYEPMDTDFWKSLGLAYHERGNAPQARIAFENAVALDPDDPAAHESLAAILMGAGELAAALELLDRVCALSPEDADTRMVLAWFLATDEDPGIRDGARAVELATQACELTNWEHPFGLDRLAAAHAEAGRWAEAVEMAGRAIRLAEQHRLPVASEFARRLELYEQRQPYRSR